MPNLSLLTKTGQIHNGGGLNWGFATGSHVSPPDAYIPIKKSEISSTRIIPTKSSCQGKVYSITFDDGKKMDILFEGTQEVSGVNYPKQISSTPHKSTLGRYFRKRLGVNSLGFVTLKDLLNYGRTDITLSFKNGQYHLDFS